MFKSLGVAQAKNRNKKEGIEMTDQEYICLLYTSDVYKRQSLMCMTAGSLLIRNWLKCRYRAVCLWELDTVCPVSYTHLSPEGNRQIPWGVSGSFYIITKNKYREGENMIGKSVPRVDAYDKVTAVSYTHLG